MCLLVLGAPSDRWTLHLVEALCASSCLSPALVGGPLCLLVLGAPSCRPRVMPPVRLRALCPFPWCLSLGWGSVSLRLVCWHFAPCCLGCPSLGTVGWSWSTWENHPLGGSRRFVNLVPMHTTGYLLY